MSEKLADVYRGEIVESRHYGDLTVVNHLGENIFSIGNPELLTYWRSCAKPFQLLPLIISGAVDKYKITSEELAVMAASHNGEKVHVKIVSNILNKIGATPADLLCGIHAPYDRQARELLYRNNQEISTLHNNCSGKHTALLAICRYYNWSTENYLSIEHPLQQLLLETVAVMAEVPQTEVMLGKDGCGVVVFGLPLSKMALAYYKLANPAALNDKQGRAARLVTDAMEKHPYLLAGRKRFNTGLMQVTKRKFTAKFGAEGVFCIGVHNGPGIAVKIGDGNKRALPPVVVELLKQLKILNAKELESLKDYHYPVVKNHRGEVVGKIVADY